MSHIVKKLLHWMFEHPTHHHYYSLHIERNESGDVKPIWKCVFVLCDDEMEVTEFE